MTPPPPFVVEIQWHAPDLMFAAALIRDGQPWFLDGGLVGMGSTPGSAVDELVAAARYLVISGQNYLTPEPLSLADREWLFSLLDTGHDPDQAMYLAISSARQTKPGEATI